MTLVDDLSRWVQERPLIVVRFDADEAESLNESRRGMERFSFARRHHQLESAKVPTLVIAEFPDGEGVRCFVGVARSKRPVTTLETGVTLVKLREIDLVSLNTLHSEAVEEKFKAALCKKINNGPFIALLTPKLSVHLIERLLSDGRNFLPFETAAAALPRIRITSDFAWAQSDALKMALATFGLGPDEAPESLHIPTGSDSNLRFLSNPAVQRPLRGNQSFRPVESFLEVSTVDRLDFRRHALEDNVIAADSASIPGFDFIQRDLTGRAVFRKADQQLVLFTANRGPLEEMFGVDLIYIHESTANIVMVQYKMLEATGAGCSDFVFRPNEQAEEELSRMRLPPYEALGTDYRLHRSPFYLKFVARKSHGPTHKSFILSKEHYDILLTHSESRGPNGGIRISYNSLRGHYLRESDIVGLIRSGYVGTYPQETASLAALIEGVSQGNRGLVFAWQKALRSNAVDSDADFE